MVQGTKGSCPMVLRLSDSKQNKQLVVSPPTPPYFLLRHKKHHYLRFVTRTSGIMAGASQFIHKEKEAQRSTDLSRVQNCVTNNLARSTLLFPCTLSRWFPLYLVQVLKFASYCILAMSLQAQPGSSVGTRSLERREF